MVRSHILLLDPLPSANRVFSMIIQHERQHSNPTWTQTHSLMQFLEKAEATHNQGGQIDT